MLLSSIVSVCPPRQSESFNWTAQPSNPTQAIKGQDVSLTWDYSLTADELSNSQTEYGIIWSKLNQSSSDYDDIAARVFITFLMLAGLIMMNPKIHIL
ncbi:hypothetical protein OS493_032404 [Desmophyllum pertusum]|uniref:Uncharacterized protein n=1 Tax=Desmophyllum pertusum TaxID=174260 RepID=A0A9X0CD07_9CNID|nr:hypothetical protein OS493_032404 [Desmophyllum pertusum]